MKRVIPSALGLGQRRCITLMPPVKVSPSPYDSPIQLRKNNRESSMGFTHTTGVSSRSDILTSQAEGDLEAKYIVDGNEDAAPSSSAEVFRHSGVLRLNDSNVHSPTIDATKSSLPVRSNLFTYQTTELALPSSGWKAPTVSRPFSSLPPANWDGDGHSSPLKVDSIDPATKSDSGKDSTVPEVSIQQTSQTDGGNRLVEFHLRRKRVLDELEKQRCVLVTSQVDPRLTTEKRNDEMTVERPVSTRRMQLLARNSSGTSVSNNFVFNKIEGVISDVDEQNHRIITGKAAVHERMLSYMTSILKTLAALWIIDTAVYVFRRLSNPDEIPSRLFSFEGTREEMRRSSILRDSGEYSDGDNSMGIPLTKEDTRRVISSWLDERPQHQQL